MEDVPVKFRTQTAIAGLATLFALGPAALAADQAATGTTSGPAAGSAVKPQTMQGGAAGVAGPTGSKNGPAEHSDAKSAQYGKATDTPGAPTTQRLQDGKTAQYGKATDTADVPSSQGVKK